MAQKMRARVSPRQKSSRCGAGEIGQNEKAACLNHRSSLPLRRSPVRVYDTEIINAAGLQEFFSGMKTETSNPAASTLANSFGREHRQCRVCAETETAPSAARAEGAAALDDALTRVAPG